MLEANEKLPMKNCLIFDELCVNLNKTCSSWKWNHSSRWLAAEFI
jgi:hypothetical protein